MDAFTKEELLKGLLVGYRKRGHRDADDQPRRAVTQDDLARFLGIWRRWYGQLESGKRVPKVEELEQIAHFLEMTPRARTALFRRALSCDPMPWPTYGDAGAAPTLWQASMDAHPTCLTDAGFTILRHNDRFASRFPYAVVGDEGSTPNLIRLLVLRPEAREHLSAWGQWAELLTAELAEALALHRENQELQRLHREVSEDQAAGPVYARAATYLFPDDECKAALIEAPSVAGARQLTLIDI
ncbi:helix-turn-helix domain-containing protein [Streptomyces sp. NPDC029704]|uniref:helix-turn-helix transcriptional regulator n=1 Tax=Streptomyces sp. NPDC029704 TaxID=3156920 RepID=UPI0033D0694B